MKRNIFKSISLIVLSGILAACGGGGGNGDSGSLSGPDDPTPDPVQPKITLSVTPKIATTAIGLTAQFDATLVTDGVNSKPSVVWSTSDASIATIDAKGVATGLKAGEVTVTGSYNKDGKSITDTATLTVTKAVVEDLQVTPAVDKIPLGTDEQYTATAFMSDHHSYDVTENPAVTWTISDPTIASIDEHGHLTSLSQGEVTITASGRANGIDFSNSAQLTITDAVVTDVILTPKVGTVASGLSKQYTATVEFSDGSTMDNINNKEIDSKLTWTTSNEEIAAVDANGLVTGVAQGEVKVHVEGTVDGKTFSDEVPLTVTAAVVQSLEITPATATVSAGKEQQYTATVTFSDKTTQDVTTDPALNWSSDNTDIATIDPKTGIATGIAPGDVTIRAKGTADGQNFDETVTLTVTDAVITSVSVTPTNADVPAGLTQQYTATATYSDGSTGDVTTSSSFDWTIAEADSGIATISETGEAAGVKASDQPVTITFSNGTDITATATITVTDAVITGLNVTPPTPEIAKGLTQAFVAQATLSDGTSQDVTNKEALSWTVEDKTIASIDTDGVATGLEVGSTQIIASGEVNGTPISAEATLTVTDAILKDLQIEPAEISQAVGIDQAFIATAIMSDDSSHIVTDNPALSWTSSDPETATISSSGDTKGTATGLKTGTVTITAKGSLGDVDKEATATFTVTDAIVIGLQVTPRDQIVPKGTTGQFKAEAKMSDGTLEDVTTDPAISWNSDTTSVVTIDSTDNKGLAKAEAVGTANITASGTIDGTLVTDSTTVTVTDAEIKEIVVTPQDQTVNAGFTQQYTAKAVYTDGVESDVTTDVTWSSSNEDAATISNVDNEAAGVTQGLATTKNVGETTITATLDGQSGTAQLEVSDALPEDLVISPQQSRLVVDSTKAFTAMLKFSNGEYVDVTDQSALNWTSTDPDVLTISNVTNAKAENIAGRATAVKAGVVDVIASGTSNGVDFRATANVTVVDTEGSVTSFKVVPEHSETAIRKDIQLSARLGFDDGTYEDVTNDPNTSWSSANTDVATVQGTGIVKGIVTGVTDGTATITAVYNSTAYGNQTADAVVDVVPNPAPYLLNVKVNHLIQRIDEEIGLGFFTSAFDGANFQLQLANPDAADWEWSSSDPNTLQVDQEGNATWLKAPQAKDTIITITVKNSADTSKTATYNNELSSWYIPVPADDYLDTSDADSLAYCHNLDLGNGSTGVWATYNDVGTLSAGTPQSNRGNLRQVAIDNKHLWSQWGDLTTYGWDQFYSVSQNWYGDSQGSKNTYADVTDMQGYVSSGTSYPIICHFSW
ncbi:MAG: Ig-like domain-containing protein [Vibrio sp.]